MTTFGSTQKEELPDEGMRIARKISRNAASFEGMNVELQIQKQQIEHLSKRIDSLVGMYQTLQGMYETLQRQRAIELNAMVNGGPTA